jgi:hypothetical protein
MFIVHLQVLQDLAEHVAQPAEEDLMRLAPPPMPNEETSFFKSRPPQDAQQISCSRPMRTRASKRRPHVWQMNS